MFINYLIFYQIIAFSNIFNIPINFKGFWTSIETPVNHYVLYYVMLFINYLII